MNPIQDLGLRTVTLIAHLGRLTAFVAQIGRNAVRPPWRVQRLVDEVYDVGVLSLAIVCLSGATVGAVLGLDGGTYISSMEGSINLEDDIAGTLLKSVIFGALVGMIATYRGYTSEPTSAGVSAATTGTVVTGSVAILLFDYVITALWGV